MKIKIPNTNVEYDVYGLKCDTPSCNFIDDSIQFKDYLKHVGQTRCPKCNSLLLTHEHQERIFTIMKYVKVFNRITIVLRWINPIFYWKWATCKYDKVYTKTITF